MKTPPRHRNVTFGRLTRDAFQFVRSQGFVSRRFGKPYAPNHKSVEVDITYRCNLRCFNCNRSCTQAPSDMEMPAAAVAAFIRESIDRNRKWERIRILGGEPTLHSRFAEILGMFDTYRQRHNPGVKLVVCTNFQGISVRRALRNLPDAFTLKSTLKSSRMNLFRPFNVAPVDTLHNRFSDYACGCRIIHDCGLGFTPTGYYMCAVAGGIDRVFGYGLGRDRLPERSDGFTDQMKTFCRLCGHFGFQWPTRKTRMTQTWITAYRSLGAGEQPEGSARGSRGLLKR